MCYLISDGFQKHNRVLYETTSTFFVLKDIVLWVAAQALNDVQWHVKQ